MGPPELDDNEKKRRIRGLRDRLRLAWRIARGRPGRTALEAMALLDDDCGVIMGVRIDPIPDAESYGLRVRSNNPQMLAIFNNVFVDIPWVSSRSVGTAGELLLYLEEPSE
jgi:hypothetical protein